MSDTIGRMDKLVTFWENHGADSGAGGKEFYELIVTTRGYLKKQGGSRNGGFADILGDNSYELIVRKQTALRNRLYDLDSQNGMAIKVEIAEPGENGPFQRRFTIQSWENVGEDYFYYKFSLTEQRA